MRIDNWIMVRTDILCRFSLISIFLRFRAPSTLRNCFSVEMFPSKANKVNLIFYTHYSQGSLVPIELTTKLIQEIGRYLDISLERPSSIKSVYYLLRELEDPALHPGVQLARAVLQLVHAGLPRLHHTQVREASVCTASSSL